MQEFIKKLPKAELHVHIEGTLEPEQLLLFAERNTIKIPYNSVDSVRASYTFANLQEFLAVYYRGQLVLCTEQDFYDLTCAYLKKAHDQGVVHAEIFFETQTYAQRNIPFSTIINGIYSATLASEKEYGITSLLMLCFLRHLPPHDAFTTLQESLPHRDKIIGVGLASTELGYPPALFKDVFAHAKSYGYHCVVHAGEAAGPEYIWQALTLLNAERIDHGVQCLSDPPLVQELRTRQVPLTVCPLSNIALKIYTTLSEHPIKKMFDAGLRVTINSDDPAYFGGYIADNYQAVADCCGFTQQELVILAKNSFVSSFLDHATQQRYLHALELYIL